MVERDFDKENKKVYYHNDMVMLRQRRWFAFPFFIAWWLMHVVSFLSLLLANAFFLRRKSHSTSLCFLPNNCFVWLSCYHTRPIPACRSVRPWSREWPPLTTRGSSPFMKKTTVSFEFMPSLGSLRSFRSSKPSYNYLHSFCLVCLVFSFLFAWGSTFVFVI